MKTEMKEATKINLRKQAQESFRNSNASFKRSPEKALNIIRWKYVRSQSEATSKHKWRIFIFDLNTKSLWDFPEHLLQSAERAFEPLAQQMIDSLLYAKSTFISKCQSTCLFRKRHIRSTSCMTWARPWKKRVGDRWRQTNSDDGNRDKNIFQIKQTTKLRTVTNDVPIV